MPEDLTPSKPEGTYLAFDYGKKRIGVASGNTISMSTTPLAIITAENSINWQQIEATVREWSPVGFVVGIPYTRDSRTTPHLQSTRAFARQLQQRFNYPVYFIDEHLSSHAAKSLSSQSTGRKKRALDDIAAAMILQTWFDK